MKTEYIIFGIVGVAVLYLISRMGGGSSGGVEYVAAQPDSASGDAQAQLDAETRLGALGMLASLAQGETEAQTTREGIAAQLSATKIAASTQLAATQIAADLQRAGIAASERVGLRQIDAQESVYLADLGNRAASEQLHINAIEKTLRDFRGISTASTGVLLNAIGAVFNKPPTYSYTQAFGEKQMPWYQPITEGVGKFISGFTNPFQSVGGGQ